MSSPENNDGYVAAEEAEMSSTSDDSSKRKHVESPGDAGSVQADNSTLPDAKRSKSTPDTGWRVKLYRLNPDGSWDDCGTGRIRCLLPNDPSLCVTAEQQDGRVLLRTRILVHDVYQRQGENIITWCEPCYPPNDPNSNNPLHQVPTDVDLALSFQDNEGCQDIWMQIKAVCAASVESVAAQAAAQHHDHVLQQQQPQPQPPMILTLPPPSLATLPLVADRVAPLVHQHREALALAVADDDGRYLRELLAVFPAAEESSDSMKPLATLAACIKSILLVNDVAILEMVVNDPEIFAQVCAALEFDPDLRQRAHHRWFLAARAKFRTVLPMDPPLVDSIQRSFRVQYLKDTLLRPTMDESSLSTLSSLQTFTHAEVIKGITSGEQEDRLKDSYLIRVIRLLGVEVYTLQQTEWADTQDDHPTITIPTPLVRSSSSAPSTPRSWGEQQHPLWKQHVAPQDSSLAARKERRKGCLAFLRELHSMVRMSLQANDKDDFFSVVSTVEIELDDGVPQDGIPRVTNLLSLLSNLLLDRVDDGEQNTILDILAAIVMHDPGLIRRHCLALPVHPRPQPNEKKQVLFLVAPKDIMAALLFLLATATDAGVLLQITEILRIILDTDMVGEAPLMCPTDVPEQQQQQQQAAIASATEQRKFIDVFYEHYIEWLVAPFALGILQPRKRVPEYRWDHPDLLLERLRTNAQSGRTDPLIHSVAPQAMRISFAVDILAYCARTHVYPARAFLYKSKTLVHVAQLLQPPNAAGANGNLNNNIVSGDRCLKLSVVRLFRSLLAVDDECYHRIIIQNDLFAYIFRALRANPVGDNLVSSAVMDLCTYIAKEEIKPLLEYIVTQHLLEKPGLEECSQPYVSTLTTMREWYEDYTVQKNQPLPPPSQDRRPSSYADAAAGTAQSAAPALTGKALEEQRRFRQADEEDSYFMDDAEGPPPSSRQPFIDTKLSRNNKATDFRRTPRMFSMATDRPPSPTSSGDAIDLEETGNPPAPPPSGQQ